MKNMTLAKKLISGFGVILVLLTISGGISYFAISQADTDFITYQAMAEANSTVGRIQANLISAQLGALKFIEDGSQKSLEEFKNRSDKTMQFTDEAQVDIKDPEHKKIVEKADADLVEYGKNFEKIVKLKDQRNHLVKDILNSNGPKMEQALTTILTTAKADNNMNAAYETSHAMRALLLGRLYTNKFLDENTSANLERATKEMADFRGQLGDVDKVLQNSTSRQLLKEITSTEKGYSAALAKLSDVVTERNRIQNVEMKNLSDDMTKNIEEVKLSILEDQTALGANVQAANQKAVIEVVILSFAAIIFGVLIAIFLIRSILRQLGGDPAEVVDIARKVADGDLGITMRTEGVDTNSLFAAIRGMVESLRGKAELAERIAQGDLTAKVTLASDRDMLGKSLQTMVGNLNDILGQIQVAGEQIASGSGQVADSSQSLSQGATEQASSLEEISASLCQLSSQTKSNAENASQANMLVSEVRTAAQQGNQQMETMVAAMSEINDAGQNISKIIKTIDEIAFQTNLLALNAAVEAARAGQHGKGFAVVAEEVRNLAARSAKAAGETAELIEGSVTKTENGSKIANQTSAALQEIVNGVGKVSDLVAEIAAASSEQAEGVGQINQGVTQIDQVTQQNTASAEESAAAAEELSGQAEQLRQMMQRFTLRNANQVRTATPPVNQNQDGWAHAHQPREATLGQSQISLNAGEFGKY